MQLGMHTYSLYHHGVAEDWAGFQLPWPRQMDIWQLMDYMEETLRFEREALQRSVLYCRDVLGIT